MPLSQGKLKHCQFRYRRQPLALQSFANGHHLPCLCLCPCRQAQDCRSIACCLPNQSRLQMSRAESCPHRSLPRRSLTKCHCLLQKCCLPNKHHLPKKHHLRTSLPSRSCPCLLAEEPTHCRQPHPQDHRHTLGLLCMAWYHYRLLRRPQSSAPWQGAHQRSAIRPAARRLNALPCSRCQKQTPLLTLFGKTGRHMQPDKREG
mmetsp:Transcript_80867/g.143220  ORF Transcript_80867/g.143220 Transcript_80867/m.143220 type:complete len:203 (-) Transcript_80867:197-805(-)